MIYGKRIWWNRLLLALLIATMCVLIANVCIAQHQTREQVLREILVDLSDSLVVLSMGPSSLPTCMGSGFFVSSDTVVTCLYIIEGANEGRALFIKRDESDIAGIIGIEPGIGIALLSIPDVYLTPLPLNDSRELSTGEEVYLWGLGGFREGFVSEVLEIDSDKLLQITTTEPLKSFDSGGPVFSLSSGKVIGMIRGISKESQNIGYAIPAYYISQFLSDTELYSAPVTPLSKQEEAFSPNSIPHIVKLRRIEAIRGRWRTLFTALYPIYRIILIAAAINIAERKGRRWWLWAISVFFFGFVPFVILIFLPSLKKDDENLDENHTESEGLRDNGRGGCRQITGSC